MNKYFKTIIIVVVVAVAAYYGYKWYQKKKEVDNTEKAIAANPELNRKVQERSRAKGTTYQSERRKMATAIVNSKKS